jgi:hypothetical protein
MFYKFLYRKNSSANEIMGKSNFLQVSTTHWKSIGFILI